MATLADSLNTAMGAHRVWKTRLLSAIATGACDVDRTTARRDDACAFGKWLLSSNETGPRRDRVAELHRRFHLAAARVLDVALAGKKPEALKMLDDAGEYAGISSALTREMTEWEHEADQCRR
jgi:hypothetical protein